MKTKGTIYMKLKNKDLMETLTPKEARERVAKPKCEHPEEKRCPRCDACTNCFPNCCKPKQGKTDVTEWEKIARMGKLLSYYESGVKQGRTELDAYKKSLIKKAKKMQKKHIANDKIQMNACCKVFEYNQALEDIIKLIK